jgi:hypothetical protein
MTLHVVSETVFDGPCGIDAHQFDGNHPQEQNRKAPDEFGADTGFHEPLLSSCVIFLTVGPRRCDARRTPESLSASCRSIPRRMNGAGLAFERVPQPTHKPI